MQITHEEARQLIQVKTDNELSPNSGAMLDSHLRECAECRSYSDSLRSAENILRQTLRKRLDVRPLPLQMDAIYAKASPNLGVSTLLTMRKAVVGIAVLMFAFLTWQTVITNGVSPQQTPLGMVPLVPTPSVSHTATNTLPSDCSQVRYVVLPGDTLDGIARQFSTSREAIILANQLTDGTLTPSRELILPVCKSTPTGTIHPPTGTITPIFEPISTTPG